MKKRSLDYNEIHRSAQTKERANLTKRVHKLHFKFPIKVSSIFQLMCMH